MKDKKYYRTYVKQRCELIDKTEKDIWDKAIFDKFIKMKEYADSKVIFIYVSYKNEVNTHEIIKKALLDRKIVCVPKILSLKDGMVCIKIESFEELRESAYGMLEPEFNIDNIIDWDFIDLVCTPGVAFDARGGRIGYGGGFYDRFFASIKKTIPKIALAYSFQIFDKVPMDEIDMHIDKVITES